MTQARVIMNKGISGILKNFTYTLSSNLLSLVISTLVIIIVPKLIGVEDYGYWQLYIFYSSYVGFFQFGWTDGIYLRYGGKRYEDLNFRLLFSQFWMLAILQLIIAFVIFIVAQSVKIQNDQKFIIFMVAICLVFTGIRAMIIFLLQATNRFKDFALINLADRTIYISILIIMLMSDSRDYKLMIFADLISKFASLMISIYICNDIVFRKISTFHVSIKEAFININVGVKLMFSNIASMLIIGIVRFGIERTWDVATFGKVSLTLSISNMMMIFINAVGIIMFPIMRRTSKDRYSNIYLRMRDILMIVFLGLLIIYYPLKSIMSVWLPQYSDSLLYMALVFPMVVYESKMALLINTYLKTLRREKVMLKINIFSMGLSSILTFTATNIFGNLNFAILNIVILLIIRSILSEWYLSKILDVKIIKDIVLEVFLTLVFISTGWFINSWMTMSVYGIFYLIYLYIKRSDIKIIINSIKLLMND